MLGSPEIILHLVYGTKTMTDKDFEVLWGGGAVVSAADSVLLKY